MRSEGGGDIKEAVIRVRERFDFSLHHEFCRFCRKINADRPDSVVIDMEDTRHLHDSGLGILIMLRERLGSICARIRIVNCSPEIRRRLSSADVDELFEIA